MARVNGGRRQSVAQRQGCTTKPLVEDFAANVRWPIFHFLIFYALYNLVWLKFLLQWRGECSLHGRNILRFSHCRVVAMTFTAVIVSERM